MRQAARRFWDEWQPIAQGDAALDLIASTAENDLSCMVCVQEVSDADEFVKDLGELLEETGKVRSVKKMSVVELLDGPGPDNLVFKSSGDENLKPNILYVLRGMTGSYNSIGSLTPHG